MEKWIDMKEQKPKDDEFVLCYFDDGFTQALYFENGGFDLWADAGEVTHWRELPKPPEILDSKYQLETKIEFALEKNIAGETLKESFTIEDILDEYDYALSDIYDMTTVETEKIIEQALSDWVHNEISYGYKVVE